MNSKSTTLFTKVDCIRLYVPDLEKGVEYYRDRLGLKLIWKSNTAFGLGMDDDLTEIVIHNEREGIEIDFTVDSVPEASATIKTAGGEIVEGPFDIKIGKCAVVKDPWDNQYVILDASKGTFLTDNDGNIIGQEK